MSCGKLYGVGVGPGAPDLMTVRSIHVLKTVDVIAIPRKDASSPSVAWTIAEPMVGPIASQERLFLNFPMIRDPAALRSARDEALSQIGDRLLAGSSVAFITEGDPFVYSTFIDVFQEAPARWPEADIEVIPGVSSVFAIGALIGMPLADGSERVAILPATYGTDDLIEVLRSFDTTVLMKVGSVLPQVVAALEAEGLLARAVYVSRATMPGERVVRDLESIRNDRGDYFSTLVVRKGDPGRGPQRPRPLDR